MEKSLVAFSLSRLLLWSEYSLTVAPNSCSLAMLVVGAEKNFFAANSKAGYLLQYQVSTYVYRTVVR